MSGGLPTAPDPPSVQVVDFARRAPSLRNTQPWRWRASDDQVELHADRRRQLPVADPSGRGLVISCGAALGHARIAAAALGWPAEVGPGDPRSQDHLATLRLRPGPATPADDEAFRLLQRRRTDRRRFTSWPVPAERLERLALAASASGVSVVPVTTDVDRLRLELIARQASHLERTTPGYLEERRGPWPSGPDPAEADSSADDIRSTDGALVLCSTDDGPESWLSTGETLCRLWMRAMQEGLSLVPLNQPVQVDQTRAALGALVGGDSLPQLVVRIGWQEIARSPLPPTPRRSLADVLDEAPGD
ncbi:NAD(P)H nitroreductase [Nocardioides hungaricus]